MKKLAIISSHPIQYNVPLFIKLSSLSTLQVKVFYTWGQAQGKVYDPGFGKVREWDIPLLNGYEYEFLDNTARDPGSHHFNGIINPDILVKLKIYAPDAILIFGWSFKSHYKVIRNFSGKATLIFRGDSTLKDETGFFRIKKFIRRIFLKWVYSHIDYALYVGQANKEYFMRHGLKEKQMIFAPHAIDNERFKDREAYELAALQWRRELGIDSQNIVFLFAGKLEPKKDPELLLNAFMKCKSNQIRLIFAGNGVLEERLMKKAEADNRVLFLPFQNQSRMPILYRLGNVFILPSKGPGETWGLSINEAMASSRAVIVSDQCGCATDLVKNGQNGFVFKSGSESQLMEYINTLANHIDYVNAFGKVSGLIINEWNYDKIVLAVQQLVQQL